MPKINVYLPDELAAAVRDAQIPVSAICQTALERAVRDVSSLRGSDAPPAGDQPGVGLFGRFTPRARQALTLAQHAAESWQHRHVDTEHVLLGVIDEGGNLALKVLEALGVEYADLRVELLASMPPKGGGRAGATAPPEHLPFSARCKEALDRTAKEALGLGHNYIGCEHLLLGLVGMEKGMAAKVLHRMGVELRTTRRAVVTALSGFVHAEQQARPVPRPEESDTLREILRRLDAIEQRLPG